MADRWVPEREVSKEYMGQAEQLVQENDSIDTVGSNSEASNGDSTAKPAEPERLGNGDVMGPAPDSASGEAAGTKKAARMSANRKAVICRFLEEEALKPGQFGEKDSDQRIEKLLNRLDERHCGGVDPTVLKQWIAKLELSKTDSADGDTGTTSRGPGKETGEKKGAKMSGKRKEIINRFLKEELLNPGQFGRIGQDRWIRKLFHRLERNTSAGIEPEDVKRWLAKPEFKETLQKLKQLEETQVDVMDVVEEPHLELAADVSVENSDPKEVPGLSFDENNQPFDAAVSMSMDVTGEDGTLKDEIIDAAGGSTVEESRKTVSENGDDVRATPVAGPSSGAESDVVVNMDQDSQDGSPVTSKAEDSTDTCVNQRIEVEEMEVVEEPKMEQDVYLSRRLPDATDYAIGAEQRRMMLPKLFLPVEESMSFDNVDGDCTFMEELMECFGDGTESVTLSGRHEEAMMEDVLSKPEELMISENAAGETSSESLDRKEPASKEIPSLPVAPNEEGKDQGPET